MFPYQRQLPGETCNNKSHVFYFLEDDDIYTNVNIEDNIFDTFSLEVEEMSIVEHKSPMAPKM